MGGLIVVLVIIAVVVIFFVGIYNGLISLRNRAENSWAQVDVQLRRRYDLIPNLVETVRRRKQAGESLKQIFHDLGENPDVLDIGMQLAVLNQSEDIRGGR